MTSDACIYKALTYGFVSCSFLFAFVATSSQQDGADQNKQFFQHNPYSFQAFGDSDSHHHPDETVPYTANQPEQLKPILEQAQAKNQQSGDANTRHTRKDGKSYYQHPQRQEPIRRSATNLHLEFIPVEMTQGGLRNEIVRHGCCSDDLIETVRFFRRDSGLRFKHASVKFVDHEAAKTALACMNNNDQLKKYNADFAFWSAVDEKLGPSLSVKAPNNNPNVQRFSNENQLHQFLMKYYYQNNWQLKQAQVLRISSTTNAESAKTISFFVIETVNVAVRNSLLKFFTAMHYSAIVW